jgi:uncharacterized protein YndB with AHSA1/START domain
MAHRLRPVDHGFVRTAPVRLVFARGITAPPRAVFRALADDVVGWAQWFPAVTVARPVRDGAGRDIQLRGGARFLETVLVTRAPDVYAHRVDVTNVPGARAVAEEWRLVPIGSGTRVQWTLAADGTAPFRAALNLAGAGLGRTFRDSLAALDRRLTA